MDRPDPMIDEPTQEELERLNAFLAGDDLAESSMDVFMMSGMFAALAFGPRAVLPSEWLPWIWNQVDGDQSPNFKGPGQANSILGIVMRLYDSVMRQRLEEGDAFEPLYEEDDLFGAASWCRGFLFGTRFDPEDWHGLLRDHPEWFTPLLVLANDAGLDLAVEVEAGERWLEDLAVSIEHLRAVWPPALHAGPEGGLGDPTLPFGEPISDRSRPSAKGHDRNLPCPCGSGKKFKKCCGASTQN